MRARLTFSWLVQAYESIACLPGAKNDFLGDSFQELERIVVWRFEASIAAALGREFDAVTRSLSTAASWLRVIREFAPSIESRLSFTCVDPSTP